MSLAFGRRAAFLIGIGLILYFTIAGTLAGRRSFADYAQARREVTDDIRRYALLLRVGEPRARAVAALHGSGANVELTQGDIVVTVLRELRLSSQCRSIVGQLHVSIDAGDRISSWETPPPNAECG